LFIRQACNINIVKGCHSAKADAMWKKIGSAASNDTSWGAKVAYERHGKVVVTYSESVSLERFEIT